MSLALLQVVCSSFLFSLFYISSLLNWCQPKTLPRVMQMQKTNTIHAGNLQCDVYKTLRAPGLLIGDGRLGGISTTLAAYELLLSRGHEVAAIAFMDPEGLGNEKIISRHVENGTLVIALPSCKPPPPLLSGTASNRPFVQRQQLDENLMKWLEQTHDSFDVLRSSIVQHHTSRVAALKNAADEGKSMLWWPFTQHGTLDAHRTSPKSTVTVVDARVGEHFIVLSDQQHSQNQNENENQQQLTQLYDACASWWTQGLSSSTQPLLTRSIAHAASRYGHIIFPQTVHQPALDLSKTLLNTVGKHWASRVFFTDDGSTAIEVALKMAFRKYMMDNKLLERGDVQLQVLGLKEAYHGDTLGAMDAVAPSVFNGRWQTPWFTGRGLFLDPPQLGIVNGTWKLLYDDGGNSDNEGGRLWSAIVSKTTESECLFNNRDDAFDVETRLQQQPALVELYKTHIDQLIIDHEQQHGKEANMQTKLGACIIEPLLQGAGGMRLLDPLYQRIMVDICRERGIPVIFDEVFSGLYRLGLPSAGHVLKTTPDVACFAKLLTGGTLPLAVTLATESIFDAFKGDEKAFALLHGHSYTAHPIGCAAAVRSLDVLSNPTTNPNTCTPSTSSASRCSCTAPCGKLKPLWDEPRITTDISTLPAVSRVVVLGTVLAVELHPTDAATGYHSNTAAAVVAQFRERGVYSRPLGNVVYVMVTPMSDKGQCDELLDVLESVLTGCLQS